MNATKSKTKWPVAILVTFSLIASGTSQEATSPQNKDRSRQLRSGKCRKFWSKKFARLFNLQEDLSTYPQWQAEDGYWLGELSFYQGDGTPFVSDEFNYPYNAYKGFITGSISGDSYRQRNVFLYPPQSQETCATTENSVVGVGTCGVNGNSRIFSADQTAGPDDCNGQISGNITPDITTITTLVGENNALLYQVFSGGELFQSQLTTLTNSDGQRRTRTAQSFFQGVPTSASFYRERKVEKEEFYAELRKYLEKYEILDSDACTTNGFGGFPTGYDGGFQDCMSHLEEGIRE